MEDPIVTNPEELREQVLPPKEIHPKSKRGIIIGVLFIFAILLLTVAAVFWKLGRGEINLPKSTEGWRSYDYEEYEFKLPPSYEIVNSGQYIDKENNFNLTVGRIENLSTNTNEPFKTLDDYIYFTNGGRDFTSPKIFVAGQEARWIGHSGSSDSSSKSVFSSVVFFSTDLKFIYKVDLQSNIDNNGDINEAGIIERERRLEQILPTFKFLAHKPKIEVTTWIPYHYEEIEFQYPPNFKPKLNETSSSGSHVTFLNENGESALEIDKYENYNQVTGKPYESLEEICRPACKGELNKIQVAGVEAADMGSSAYFISPDGAWQYWVTVSSFKPPVIAHGRTFTNSNDYLKEILSTCKFVETATTDVTATWKVYQDAANGLEFKYPNSWYIESLADWSLNVFLEDKPIKIPEASEFMSSIQISYNDVMNTETNLISPMEKTLDEGVTRFKEDVFETAGLQVTDLTVSGRKAVQMTGVWKLDGMFGGSYVKYTLIQIDGRLLEVVLNNKDYENIYNQILTSIKIS